MPNKPDADRLEELPQKALYQDVNVCCYQEEETGYLVFTSCQAAGAIGRAQGESFLQALQALEKVSIRTLKMTINSAGASFNEPLEGLFYLNAILEALWRFRVRGILLTVLCEKWLYGGMAMTVCTVANEVYLGSGCRMGLIGSREKAELLLPEAGFRPEHLRLACLTD